ncbi:hypothetical protein DUI87_03379 [Hirundo rustica rustica]|uniref:Integrase zinc-binding domain-containing protein n=1 Tax=Hirundo rustica rustica TaxID=333673 RepID=A0A3M0L773_HIRRU|nr:hypothetical protein DUI87_03379 [Hirundo rustica rustica]
MDLTMDSISEVIHDCETCAAIKQAKQMKPPWYVGQWSKYNYGEAWQIDCITLPQTCQVYAQTAISVKNIICERKRQINEYIKASSLGLLGWEKK